LPNLIPVLMTFFSYFVLGREGQVGGTLQDNYIS
jgi:hypothetical protein